MPGEVSFDDFDVDKVSVTGEGKGWDFLDNEVLGGGFKKTLGALVFCELKRQSH